MIEPADIDEALDRLARSADGALLYRYLQDIRCRILAGDPSDSALRANHGARSLAENLMAKMAKGIDESGGRTGHATIDGHATGNPVVFLSRPAVVAARSRSLRDQLIASDPELARYRVSSGDD